MPPSAAEITWIAKFLGVSEDDVRGNHKLARQVEIMQDMADSGRTFDGQETDTDDGPADPDFNEPGRMPELDKGPMPDQRLVPMEDIRYTQNNISDTMSDGRPVSAIAESMAREGWDPNSPDPDMVLNEHGGATTLDHRRLVAAEEARLSEVPAQIHGPDDPLPEEMEGRFTLRQDIMDGEDVETPAGTEPETWGEAARFRAANQMPEPGDEDAASGAEATDQFPPEPGNEEATSGAKAANRFPLDGETRQPYLKSEKVLSPAEAAKAAKKAGKEAARLERKQPGNRADKALEDLKKTDPEAAKAIEKVKAEFDQAEARREADLDPDAPQPGRTEPGVPDPMEPSPGTRPGPRGGPAAADAAPPEPAIPQARMPGRAPAPAAEPAQVPQAGAGMQAPATEPSPVRPAIPEPTAAAPAPAEPVPNAPEPATASNAASEAAAADAGAGAALGAGAVGGLMTGGMTLLGDIDKVRSGQMTVAAAAKDAGAKTVEGGILTYGGAKLADTVVKGAATATSGAEGALGGAENAAAGGGAAAAGASLAGVVSKGGVIGGVVAGGLALIDDVGKVRDGQMTGGTATVDVGVKTAVGVGAGMAGAYVGAEIGTLAGSVVPGVGNVVGFVAGAVVGGAVGYIGNKLMETETGREVIHAAGAAVDTAIDGVEAAGKEVGHEAVVVGKAVAGAAGAAVDGVEKVAGAVAGAAGSAAHAVEDTASHVLDGASSLFGKIKDAL